MPARDLYHDVARQALEHAGWVVTDDPLVLEFGDYHFYIDLGTESLLGITAGNRRLAVEIKSFVGPSLIADLELAIGQFMLYRLVLSQVDPGRELYLGVTDQLFDRIFDTELGRLIVRSLNLNLLIFNPIEGRIVQWLPS